MQQQTIGVLGGTGFVGKRLVVHLANRGLKLKVLCRHRHRHRQLIVMPNVRLIEADIGDPQILRTHLADCDAVINLVGILNGTETEFQALHVELPRQVAALCQEIGVRRLLHMSALHADVERGPSLYLRSKGAGEQAVRAATGIHATVFQPSVIFGPDDSFFNRFAALLNLSPVLPLACPNARFAPVYVEDVVAAFDAALCNPDTFGQSLQLCGPHAYTLRELVKYTAKLSQHKRWIIDLPDSLARLQAKILAHWPGTPFTLDNYLSLQVDSVCCNNGFDQLGLVPQAVEAIMPACFERWYSRAVRYRDFRRTARHDTAPDSLQ
ncbi:MAG: complex I NDUFA9 subunit family protein [Candidatus Competibacteraceae bacterium]|nr:complex I NDUFA9 subunit family protein [Candidatus Competibacteraceae bacterium]